MVLIIYFFFFSFFWQCDGLMLYCKRDLRSLGLLFDLGYLSALETANVGVGIGSWKGRFLWAGRRGKAQASSAGFVSLNHVAALLEACSS